ncbi:hypothetical protein [Bordetella sp. 02P26C-1]|uniref:hypothetical protein n=1 Tax=Bordetella sp. 02P26C-1 TaxID=2683195 RepID=UPI001353C848|nr:hypothetical protein [Bordetella sp. 02P26C-1]MVW80429.1 hypothetical protein [Bordetella sp. 02P26C-1]
MPVSQTENDQSDTLLCATATQAEIAAALTAASQVKAPASTASQLRQYMQQNSAAQYGHADAVLSLVNSQEA